MVRKGQTIIGATHRASRLRIIAELPGDEVLVVRVRGEIDTDSSRTFDHYLGSRLPAEARFVVVDTSQVELLGARGVRTLIEHANRLSARGRQMLVVASTPLVRRVLEATGAAASLRLFDSLPLAMAACDGAVKATDRQGGAVGEPGEPADELTGLQREVHGLRVALRTRLVVARALGVVQERYDLDCDAAFDILRESAQRHNLRVHILANALLSTAAPQDPAWFPGRRRRPAPSLSFVEQSRDHRRNRDAILGALLNAASHVMSAAMTSVHLVDPTDDVMRMELSANMPIALAGQLTETDGPVAMGMVADIAAETDLGAVGVALLDAGVQAMHSTSLVTEENQLIGMVTAYYTESGRTPSRLQCARLDHVAGEVATWLDWHARTVVPDALEHLHRLGASTGD
ncbi:STAS domain-containing protein [Kibdelosporangium phytohabitans]|uniref:STAS domain-containing protein n=1 Tax=Kibdelosporangium phytohabitans TaxID=860235 RepID=A0A0N9I144_9PSEU|nr:STAS domain-containing protein [Kibdelosporangium phytohabitans]ALG09534.1 hypothetical protein AOZ06_23840 [Kibdelosporangium phytohabitans]MBE1469160.1 anti-anti-sigma factor [Kibdelosporangium phytohabitans]